MMPVKLISVVTAVVSFEVITFLHFLISKGADFIPTNNEPSGSEADIWRVSRGSNAPTACCGVAAF